MILFQNDSSNDRKKNYKLLSNWSFTVGRVG